jgi:hypothetical protein
MLFLDDVTLTGFYAARTLRRIGTAKAAAMQEDIVRCLVEDPPQAPLAGTYRLADAGEAVAHAARVGMDRPGKIVLVP